MKLRSKRGGKPRAKEPLKRARGNRIGTLLLCLLILALLCIPAIFVNSLIGYIPALFFVGIVGLSYLYNRLCTRGFAFDELAESASCLRGGSVDVRLRLRNASALFVPRVDVEFAVHDLFGNETSTDAVAVALNPRAIQDFSFALQFGHIGQFDVGLKRLTVHDPLRLFRRQLPVDSCCSITVTPRLREVDDIPLSDAAVKQVSEALRPSANPGSDYCGVRDYVPGDPMKLIHWKLSARGEAYYTKLFEEQSDPSLDIYLDTSAPDYDTETLMCVYDSAIETALSLEAYAQERGLDTRLLFLNAEGEFDQFRLAPGSDFRDLMRRIPLVTPSPSSTFEHMLAQRGTTLQAADNIAVCSANIDSGMAETLAHVKATQRNVIVFALVPDSAPSQESAQMRATLRTLGAAGVMGYLVDAGGERP